MLLIRYGAVLAAMALTCSAQLPEYYKTVNRVTWVVGHIDKVRPAWQALGLTDIQEFVNIELTGQYKGKPISIRAWQITGRLGNLTIDMLQPGEGQANAYTNFLSKHGDGILSIVHEVPDRSALDQEIARMKAKGVDVLQQVRTGPVTFTYFDTEPEGKFALGLILREGKKADPPPQQPAFVSHFGAVIWDAKAVSAYWEKLGFPAFPMAHATPRPDSRYKGEPLSLAFEVGFQRHTQFRMEWISPPANPPNVYADFLNRRKREGIQHIGVEIGDLAKATAEHEKLGYHVHQAGAWGDVGKSGSGHYAYMDTNSVGGVSLELVRRFQ